MASGVKIGTGLLAAVILAGLTGDPARAAAVDQRRAYEKFVREFRTVARRHGIPGALYDRAFRGLTPDPEVIEKNDRQPEFVLPPSHYMALVVTDTRVTGRPSEAHRARRRPGRHRTPVRRRPPRAGGHLGHGDALRCPARQRNVIRSLSTLGYKGRRTRFGRTQLLAALNILKAGDITIERMTGSWAGAMGHTQFIPSSYQAYAVDFTGDGRRDIWDTPQDALASTANYLRRNGWITGRPWGHEVVLPKHFDEGLAGRKQERTIRKWQRLGLRPADGKRFPYPEDRAYLYVPAGPDGPAFLLRRNFRSIMRYNPAHKYALAIGHLADRLRGESRVLTWPSGIRPMAEPDRKELQRLLAAKGYDIGEVDGILGPRTRAAVRDYQKKQQRRADGFPRPELLELLRADSPTRP